MSGGGCWSRCGIPQPICAIYISTAIAGPVTDWAIVAVGPSSYFLPSTTGSMAVATEVRMARRWLINYVRLMTFSEHIDIDKDAIYAFDVAIHMTDAAMNAGWIGQPGHGITAEWAVSVSVPLAKDGTQVFSQC